MSMGKKMNRWEWQLQNHFVDKLDKIGTSKKEAFDKGNYEGIHGAKTYKDYKYWSEKYIEYVKENYNGEYRSKEWDSIFSIPKDIQREYILEKIDQGLSNYSLKTIVSAINKVFNPEESSKWSPTEDFGIVRSYEDIVRSRDFSITEAQSEHNNGQILIAESFGLRRSSIYGGDYAIKPESFYVHNNNIYVDVIEKGGRFRSTVCLDSKMEEVKEYLSKYGYLREQEYISSSKEEFKINYQNSESDQIFTKYDRNIDNHHFRGEYAKALYNELVEEKGSENIDYRGYDSTILKEVSHNLGHNRIDVVVYHYLR